MRIALEAKTNLKSASVSSIKQRQKKQLGHLDKHKIILLMTKTCIELNECCFCSVFTKQDTSSQPEHTQLFTRGDDEKLCEVNISREEVLREINKLKETQLPGPDDISPCVLKETKDITAEPLTRIFMNILDSRKMPPFWKKVNVVQIFKKEDKSTISNYQSDIGHGKLL